MWCRGGVYSMHNYLKSVGFSQIRKRSEIRNLILDVVKNHEEMNVVQGYEDGDFAEFSKSFGENCGITVCGQYDDQNRFHPDYYFPYFKGSRISTQEHSVIERHAEKESFAGACDDLRIGVTLIFYLQNAAEYMKESDRYKGELPDLPLSLSALASEGRILLPIEKDKQAVMVEKEAAKNRSNLISAARNGDQDAMESLTMEDMDTYSMITQRIMTDDIFTIVDSYFMPYGIECDQYNIMGEIQEVSFHKNEMTGEELCQMSLESNDMQFDVCINKKDLLGEPLVGRRFKGLIWLQGRLHLN